MLAKSALQFSESGNSPPTCTVLPHCFTVQEIASRLKLSEETVRNQLQDFPGVLKITKGKRLRGKREYVTLRVPEPVMAEYLRRCAA